MVRRPLANSKAEELEWKGEEEVDSENRGRLLCDKRTGKGMEYRREREGRVSEGWRWWIVSGTFSFCFGALGPWEVVVVAMGMAEDGGRVL